MEQTVDYRDDPGVSTWSIVEGVVLVVIGLFAIFSPLAVAAAAAVIFPVFLLAKGIVELIVAFRTRTGSLMVWHAVFGVVSVLAGIALLARPALAGLTLVIVFIAYFFIDGMARVVISLWRRGHGWGWVLTSGIVSIVLGVFLLGQPATVTLFILGLLLGINILAAGIAMIAAGAMERQHIHRVSPA